MTKSKQTRKDGFFELFYRFFAWVVLGFLILLLALDILLQNSPSSQNTDGWVVAEKIIRDLLPNLIATGFLFILSFWLIRKFQTREREDYETRFAAVVAQEVKNMFPDNSIMDAGIQQVFKKLSEVELVPLAKGAQSRVWILTTMLFDYGGLEKVLKETIRNNGRVPVSVVMLDPNDDVAKRRGEDAGKISSMPGKEWLEHWAKKYGIDITLKYCNQLPYKQIYIFDNTVVTGTYWKGARGSDRLHLKVNSLVGDYGNQLIEEFQAFWKESDVVNSPYFQDLTGSDGLPRLGMFPQNTVSI